MNPLSSMTNMPLKAIEKTEKYVTKSEAYYKLKAISAVNLCTKYVCQNAHYWKFDIYNFCVYNYCLRYSVESFFRKLRVWMSINLSFYWFCNFYTI